jgi:hypothetical protein
MIEILILNSLLIRGLQFAYSPFNVLYFISKAYTNLVADKPYLLPLNKPLFNCAPCMASIYGLPGFYYTDLEWYYYPVYVVALAGINTIKTQ